MAKKKYLIKLQRVVSVTIEEAVIEREYDFEARAFCDQIKEVWDTFPSLAGQAGEEVTATYKHIPDPTPIEAVCNAAQKLVDEEVAQALDKLQELEEVAA